MSLQSLEVLDNQEWSQTLPNSAAMRLRRMTPWGPLRKMPIVNPRRGPNRGRRKPRLMAYIMLILALDVHAHPSANVREVHLLRRTLKRCEAPS